MNKLAKILIIGGILVAVLVLGRSLYYAPNSEADSGLEASVVVGTMIDSVPEDSLPSRLLIPRLGIDADVQRLGITTAGNMAAPDNFTDVSWYKFGTIPGNIGSAVISGHEDNAIALDGVFKHLEDLEIGDDIFVAQEDGTQVHFRVTDKKLYPYNLTGPNLEKIFTAKDKARLNLITCAGNWLPSAKTNDTRLVVYTELVN